MVYNDNFHKRRKDKPYYKTISTTFMDVISSFSTNESKENSLLDIGCSIGAFLATFNIETKYGIDFGKAKDNFLPNAGKFIEHDFTKDGILVLQKKFDLITSLEVIEHIPKKFENDFFNTIDENSHEGTILLFSGAHIGQKGRHHVNCQDSWYWINKLCKIGFLHNSIMTNTFIAKCGLKIPRCYRENIMIFIRS